MLRGVQVCAYSHTAALSNYSFLVRYARSSKSPICTWKKYTLITPSGMTDAVCPACMHAVSAICPWATVLFYNNNSCLVYLMVGLIMCQRLTLMVPPLVRRHAPAM